jgi:anti-sigma regulatory factor (Ser/Thr protein kinase)
MLLERPMAFVFPTRSIPPDRPESIRSLRERFPGMPLLGIRASEGPEEVSALLQAGLQACLEPSRLAEEFAFNVIKLLAAQTETYHAFSLYYEERLLILPNDFSLIMPVAKALVEDTLPPHEKSRYHLILGLSEIITNAIEHGNLGFTFEEKSHALKSSRFFSLAQDRAHREPYKNRLVTVRRRVLPHLKRIEYWVADQGPGFDWRTIPDPKDKANMFNRHGRGLMMARHAFDEMHFNDTGNEVTLVVHRDATKKKAA